MVELVAGHVLCSQLGHQYSHDAEEEQQVHLLKHTRVVLVDRTLPGVVTTSPTRPSGQRSKRSKVRDFKAVLTMMKSRTGALRIHQIHSTRRVSQHLQGHRALSLHTHIHTHTHTHAVTHTPSLHTHIHTRCHSHAVTHTHTHTLSLTRRHYTHIHTLLLTHTHTHAVSHTHTHTHTLCWAD